MFVSEVLASAFFDFNKWVDFETFQILLARSNTWSFATNLNRSIWLLAQCFTEVQLRFAAIL